MAENATIDMIPREIIALIISNNVYIARAVCKKWYEIVRTLKYDQLTAIYNWYSAMHAGVFETTNNLLLLKCAMLYGQPRAVNGLVIAGSVIRQSHWQYNCCITVVKEYTLDVIYCVDIINGHLNVELKSKYKIISGCDIGLRLLADMLKTMNVEVHPEFLIVPGEIKNVKWFGEYCMSRKFAGRDIGIPHNGPYPLRRKYCEVMGINSGLALNRNLDIIIDDLTDDIAYMDENLPKFAGLSQLARDKLFNSVAMFGGDRIDKLLDKDLTGLTILNGCYLDDGLLHKLHDVGAEFCITKFGAANIQLMVGKMKALPDCEFFTTSIDIIMNHWSINDIAKVKGTAGSFKTSHCVVLFFNYWTRITLIAREIRQKAR